MSDDTSRTATLPEARDHATTELIEIARNAGISTVWDRYKSQQPQCKYGTTGVCCRLCHMGPCRISSKGPLGICGANADTITARNLLREIAAGTAAHSDHGRMLVQTLKKVSKGLGGSYKITDPRRLREVAKAFDIAVDDRGDLDIAAELADFFVTQFAWSDQPNATLKAAPEKRQALWEKLGIQPHGIDSSVVEIMHRTTMGVDSEYRHLIMGGLKCSLADGWVGSLIATAVTDPCAAQSTLASSPRIR